jgi:hypothetical protein
MEPEDSLPCSQEPSTAPYPEPDQSNPYHPIYNFVFGSVWVWNLVSDIKGGT